MRIPLKENTEIKANIGRFLIDSVLSEGGGTSIVYNAHWYLPEANQSTPVILKEFYPKEHILGGVRREENGTVVFPSDDYLRLLDIFKRQVTVNNDISSIMVDSAERISGYFDHMYGFAQNGTYYVFSEARAAGTVQQLIKKRGLPRNVEDFRKAFEFSKRVIESIQPIHNKGYAHLDIKGDNLYISDLCVNESWEKTVVKAIDFGSCVNLGEGDTNERHTLLCTYSKDGDNYVPSAFLELLEETVDDKGSVSNEWVRENRKLLVSCDCFAIRNIIFVLLFGSTPERLCSGDVITRLQFFDGEPTGINVIEASYIERLLLEDFPKRNHTLDDLKVYVDLVLKLLNRESLDSGVTMNQDLINDYNAHLLKAKSEDYYREHQKTIFRTKHYPRKFVPNQGPVEVDLSADVFEVAIKERQTQQEELELYLKNISQSTSLEGLLKKNMLEHKLYYLQGLGGSGKTVALSKLYMWCLGHKECIPLYCDLSFVDEVGKDLEDNCILKHISKQLGFKYVDTLSLLKSKCKIVLLLDNYQKIGYAYNNAIDNELSNFPENISIILAGRNELALSELPQFKRVKLQGVNRAEIDVELPSSKIFDLPHFAMLYRDLNLAKATGKERYGDEYARAKILFDYLIPDRNSLFDSNSLLENTYESGIILKHLLPSIAYRALIKEEGITLYDVEKELESQYSINQNGLFENLASMAMSIVSVDNGYISFNHDTYLEFLCAYHIATSIKKVLDNSIPMYEKAGAIRTVGETDWTNTEVQEMVSEIMKSDLIYSASPISFIDRLDEQISVKQNKQLLMDIVNTEAGKWFPYNIIKTFFLPVEESLETTYHNKEYRLKELEQKSIVDLDRAFQWSNTTTDNSFPELLNIKGLYFWMKGDVNKAEHCFDMAGEDGFYLSYRNHGLAEFSLGDSSKERQVHVNRGKNYLLLGFDTFRDYKCISYLAQNFGFLKHTTAIELSDEDLVRRIRLCEDMAITDDNYYRSLARLLQYFSIHHSKYTGELFDIVEKSGYADGLDNYWASRFYLLTENDTDRALRCIDNAIERSSDLEEVWIGRFFHWKGFIISNIPQKANEACEYFFKAIDNEYYSSYINLGKGYLYGTIGLYKDYDEAEKCFMKVVDLIKPDVEGYIHPDDYGMAYYYLGILREKQTLYSEAIEMFLKGEGWGNYDAICHLGDIYNPHKGTHDYYKHIISEEENKFIRYYKAAENNHVEATLNMAKCYENGWGVPVSTLEAIKRYRYLSQTRKKQNINNVHALDEIWNELRFYENGDIERGTTHNGAFFGIRIVSNDFGFTVIEKNDKEPLQISIGLSFNARYKLYKVSEYREENETTCRLLCDKENACVNREGTPLALIISHINDSIPGFSKDVFNMLDSMWAYYINALKESNYSYDYSGELMDIAFSIVQNDKSYPIPMDRMSIYIQDLQGAINGFNRESVRSGSSQYKEDASSKTCELIKAKIEGLQQERIRNIHLPLVGSHDDSLFREAIDYVIDEGRASVSLLQRRFRIEYHVASNLIDRMEELGIISSQEGYSPRQVLVHKYRPIGEVQSGEGSES